MYLKFMHENLFKPKLVFIIMAKKEIFDEKKIEAYTLKNAVEHDGKAIISSVISGLFAEGLKKEDVKDIIPKINEILKKVNSMSIDEQKNKLEELEKLLSHRDVRDINELPELEDAKIGKVITRFAPSPSGPLHIGHAATGMPSSIYAKKYKGKFYLRIEDTNPENIDPEAYKMIPEEANWLFGNVTEFIIQSDKLNRYYDFAEKLIKKDAAYICDCNPEKFKELIKKSKACPCRNLSVNMNMEKWRKMLDKKGYKDGEAVLRFKSDLNNPNPALRDFPLARVNTENHPRQGKKFRVWPLMNLSVTVDDIDFKSTHVIRAKEHRDSSKRQEMMMKVFNIKPPKTYFLGRYNFSDMEISCTKTKAMIKEGKFSGWDDIKLPFIAALMKRGYQAEAFEKMAIQRGISEVDKVLSKEDYFEVLDNINRDIIHEKATRVHFNETKEKPNVEILMPNKKIVRGKAEDLDLKKLKECSIVHFISLGYCRYNKDEKVKFWFCHQ